MRLLINTNFNMSIMLYYILGTFNNALYGISKFS